MKYRIAGLSFIAMATVVFSLMLSSCDLFMNKTLPESVDITIIGAVVSPADASNSNWDGTGKLAVDIITKLASLNPKTAAAAAILSFFADTILSAYDPPDPIGTAAIDFNDGTGFVSQITLANDDNNQEDTYKPIWPNAPGWKGVKTAKGMRVKVNILDADWPHWLGNDDDPIGTANISYESLVEAYNAGEAFYVNTAAQTLDMIMLISIEVKDSSQ